MSDRHSEAPRDARDGGADYVSRGGIKLAHALERLSIDLRDRRCADLGCSTGGFTDCLLRHGAREVIAVDTGYGVLAWRLRNDPRVTVRERENALHAPPPDEPVDLVAIDLGWTPQRLAIPAALRWIDDGTIVTLVKPHYEASDLGLAVPRGGLPDDLVDTVMQRVMATFEGLALAVGGTVESPIRGAKSARRGPGNREFLVRLRRR